MSDKKHIEYCIKLGNTLVKPYKDEIKNNYSFMDEQNYYGNSNEFAQSNYSQNLSRHDEMMNFKERLKNWK